MEDLFEREQRIANRAASHMEQIRNGMPCSVEEYAVLAREYQRLLKQIRRVTKISDRTTVNLNASKLDLLDKVQVDEMTDIFNRRFLDENLHRILCALARSRRVLSVLMIDVDFFKRYNDTYGHSKGDECLRKVAKAVNCCTQSVSDFAARYGGEEFVLVLPDTDAEVAKVIAERVLRNVRDQRIPHEKNDASEFVSVSVGITTGIVEASHTMEDYIRSADKALYHSKQNGRNQSTFLQLGEEINYDV